MSPDDIRQEIELKVVELIKKKLTDGTMTEDRSRQLSQLVLDILKPGMSMEELYRAIFSLDDNASELSTIILPYAKQYEFNVTQKTVDIVKNYINVGNYDAAVNLAKRAIKNEVKLEWQGNGRPEKTPITPLQTSPMPIHEPDPTLEPLEQNSSDVPIPSPTNPIQPSLSPI